MGFSALGLAVSLAVLTPNLLLLLLTPRTPLPVVDCPRTLIWVEWLGQALCLTVPAFTVGWGISPWWGVPLVVALAGYWVLWIRYAIARTPAVLFGGMWGIPVPMAILPVCVFLTCAVMLANPWIAAAAVTLAIGHIPMSLLRARAVEHA